MVHACTDFRFLLFLPFFALQAKAFSECCFTFMKQVVNDTNTRLGDNFVDKVTTFCANEKIMKFMKANHHHEVFTTKKSDPMFTEDLIDEIGALFIDE